MHTCGTCKFWRRGGADEHKDERDLELGECTATPMLWSATEWNRTCTKRILRPKYAHTKAFVQDRSDYMATLYTKADFGCVMHESNANMAE